MESSVNLFSFGSVSITVMDCVNVHKKVSWIFGLRKIYTAMLLFIKTET